MHLMYLTKQLPCKQFVSYLSQDLDCTDEPILAVLKLHPRTIPKQDYPTYARKIEIKNITSNSKDLVDPCSPMI